VLKVVKMVVRFSSVKFYHLGQPAHLTVLVTSVFLANLTVGGPLSIVSGQLFAIGL
jgi:hypothetical protein